MLEEDASHGQCTSPAFHIAHLECPHTKHVSLMAPQEHQIDSLVGQEGKKLSAPFLSAVEPAYPDVSSIRCLRPRYLLVVGKGSISLHTPDVYLFQSISGQPLYLLPQKTEENFEVGTILLTRMIPIKEFSTHLQYLDLQVTSEEVTPPACYYLVNPLLS